MEEIRLVFFLPLLYLMMTSGLPPGDFALRDSNSSLEEGHNESGTQKNDWKDVMTTAWTKLTFTNETHERVGLDEKEHLNSTQEFEHDSNPNSISNRSVIINSTTTSSSRNGTSSDKGSDEEKISNESNNRKTEELPPIHAPLHQNHTNVPLRGNCNNSTHVCTGQYVECRSGTCKCREGYGLISEKICGEREVYNMDIPTTDPTMIGVIVGLILMSVTLCIVLRLFAKARFRENRTIFNTPNPRLMNVSLMKGSKQLLRGNSGNNPSRSRRGSQVSLQSTSDLPPPQRSPPSPKNENGNGKFEGSTPRPKVSRQMSTDVNGPAVTAETAKPASAGVNRYKYRQDSVASNV